MVVLHWVAVLFSVGSRLLGWGRMDYNIPLGSCTIPLGSCTV